MPISSRGGAKLGTNHGQNEKTLPIRMSMPWRSWRAESGHNRGQQAHSNAAPSSGGQVQHVEDGQNQIDGDLIVQHLPRPLNCRRREQPERAEQKG